MFEQGGVGFESSIRISDAPSVGRGSGGANPTVGILQQQVGMAGHIHFQEPAFAGRKSRQEKLLSICRPSWHLTSRLCRSGVNHLDLFALQVQDTDRIGEILYNSYPGSVGGYAPIGVTF